MSRRFILQRKISKPDSLWGSLNFLPSSRAYIRLTLCSKRPYLSISIEGDNLWKTLNSQCSNMMNIKFAIFLPLRADTSMNFKLYFPVKRFITLYKTSRSY